MNKNKFILMPHNDFSTLISERGYFSDEEENNLLDSGRWDLFLIYLEKKQPGRYSLPKIYQNGSQRIYHTVYKKIQTV